MIAAMTQDPDLTRCQRGAATNHVVHLEQNVEFWTYGLFVSYLRWTVFSIACKLF